VSLEEYNFVKAKNTTDFYSGKTWGVSSRKRFLLYLFPFWIIDPNANVWIGTYEKRRNEISPLGRHGSLWQRFGTRSPIFKVSGKLNFENIIRKWVPYLRFLYAGDKIMRTQNIDMWFDPKVVKFALEYIWQADAAMLMTTDLDMSIVTLDKMVWKQVGDEQLAYSYTLELVEVRPIPIEVKGPLNMFMPNVWVK